MLVGDRERLGKMSRISLSMEESWPRRALAIHPQTSSFSALMQTPGQLSERPLRFLLRSSRAIAANDIVVINHRIRGPYMSGVPVFSPNNTPIQLLPCSTRKRKAFKPAAMDGSASCHMSKLSTNPSSTSS